MFKVKITGMDKLKKEMDKVVKEMQEALDGGVEEAAEYAAETVRENTPEGPKGNLRKAVATKKLPDKPGYPAVAMVGLDYRIAPHQHLVEFGSVSRFQYKRENKYVGSMPANPFFRRSINQAREGIKERIRIKVKEPIDRRR